jgi:hypothetical protein
MYPGAEKNCCKNEIADLKKKKNKNKKIRTLKGYCRRPTEISSNHDAEGPPIALGAPNLEGPSGIFPTSLYGRSAPECICLKAQNIFF